MKTRVARFCVCLTWALATFMVATCISPPAGHFDFNLRMNEIACVRRGVNPFFVWNEDMYFPPYVSNLPKKPVPEGCVEQVNAYAPWAYTYMMPISFLPKPVAWSVYCLMMGSMLLVLLRVLGWTGEEARDPDEKTLLSVVPFITVSYLFWSNVSVGNFIVFVLAGSVLMGVMLSRGREFAGGVLWAFAMIKPQSAILFAMPLLMRKKFFVCVVAGVFCLLASLLPSYLCGTPVWTLLRQGPAANVELFEGCGTWPKFLCGTFGQTGDILAGLAIGTVLCLVMTWSLRKERDWLVYLMPAAVCASCWTYTQAYSHAMGWFLAYAIVKELLRCPASKAMWILMILSVPVLSRVFLAWHGLYAYMGWEFPMSEFAFRSIDSLNSTATLALAVAFCFLKNRTETKASTTGPNGGVIS